MRIFDFHTLQITTTNFERMERCHNLIRIGANWEKNGLHLNHGQFMMGVTQNQEEIVAESRYRLAARLIYGAVILGWLYVSLVGVLLVIV